MKPNKAIFNPMWGLFWMRNRDNKRGQSHSGGGQGGEEDVKGEALAGGAFGNQIALVGVDDLAGKEEFKADLFAGPAGVKGVEKFFQRMRFEAGAVIVNLEMDIVARRQQGGYLGVQWAAGQGESDEAAPLMEALPAVEAEVEQDLLELGDIGIDPGASGVVAKLEFDLVRDDAAQDLEALLDGRGERYGLAVNGWALRKRADFVEEITGAIAGFENLLQGFVGGVAFLNIHGDEFGAAKDAGDDVVEFVGDAAGELVEGVEFLIEQKLGFIAPAGGGIGMGERADFGGEIRGGSISWVGLAWLHGDMTGGSVGSFEGGGDKKFSGEIKVPGISTDSLGVARLEAGSQKSRRGKTVFRPLNGTPATRMLRKSNAPPGATHGKSKLWSSTQTCRLRMRLRF